MPNNPLNSIYTPGFDSRYGNPLINQQTGAWQPYSASIGSTSPTGSPTTGSATGAGGFSPGAAPDLSSLSSMVNQLNLQGQQASNAARIPNATGLETQSSANIGQELAGQVPSDVINLLQQQAAERGIATGSPGSDNSNAAYLRSLGLTSLGQEQTGQADLTRALARNPGAPIFDPTTQLLTPYQAGSLNDRAAQRQLDWYNALMGHTGSGGGGGGRQPTTQDSGTSGVPNWFPTAGGTPSPPPPPPLPGGGSPSSPTTFLGQPAPTVGYDQPSPYGVGYTAPSTGMGDIFGGLSGVGYDQGNTGYGVGYDQTTQPNFGMTGNYPFLQYPSGG